MSNQLPSREPRYPCMTQLHTRGTFYDIGYNVGLNFSQCIKLFFQESQSIQNKLLPFYDTPTGREYYEEALHVTEQAFPEYVREVRGMSDGSGVSFEKLFMLNTSKEVLSVLYDQELKKRSFQENVGCSDVFLNRPDLKLIVHNEDCDPMIKPYGYLLTADIQDGHLREHFTAFCYPGILAGTAFSFNMHGLSFTVDGLYAQDVVRDSPCRHFLNRAVLKAKDKADVCRILENEPFGVAYGFCVNVSSPDYKMFSVEVGPNKPKSRLHVHDVEEEVDPNKPCHYYHFNSYKGLQVQELGLLKSSLHRTQRASQLPPPRTLQDALVVLSDAQDKDYPIFRTPRTTDSALTVNTAVFDVLGRHVSVYQGVSTASSPFLRLPMYK